jgi:hypothetical protein
LFRGPGCKEQHSLQRGRQTGGPQSKRGRGDTQIDSHFRKHMPQAHTPTHPPAKSQHSSGMSLAEDITAAVLASLPMCPPCPSSFSQASSAFLHFPKANLGLCPSHSSFALAMDSGPQCWFRSECRPCLP